jgi:hypothetical protein
VEGRGGITTTTTRVVVTAVADGWGNEFSSGSSSAFAASFPGWLPPGRLTLSGGGIWHGMGGDSRVVAASCNPGRLFRPGILEFGAGCVVPPAQPLVER